MTVKGKYKSAVIWVINVKWYAVLCLLPYHVSTAVQTSLPLVYISHRSTICWSGRLHYHSNIKKTTTWKLCMSKNNIIQSGIFIIRWDGWETFLSFSWQLLNCYVCVKWECNFLSLFLSVSASSSPFSLLITDFCHVIYSFVFTYFGKNAHSDIHHSRVWYQLMKWHKFSKCHIH